MTTYPTEILGAEDGSSLFSPVTDEAGADPEGQNEDSGTFTEASTTEPFNPTQIRVSNKLYSLDSLLARIEENEIELQPEFQREAGIWSNGAKSRLIESLLVRIPLPAFYLDATNEDKWRVIDGLQRLTTLKNFVIDKSLRLSGLEITPQFNGMSYDELPRTFQRRIRETQLTVVQIEAGTPKEAVYAIFSRINTGGLPLSSQEIRHALFQGQATDMLKELAESAEFQNAIRRSIRNTRMADREFVLRALAFMLTPYTAYQTEDLDGFLNKQLDAINDASPQENQKLKERFKRAMNCAQAILGRNAFRKMSFSDRNLNPVNRALFEVWAVLLDSLDDAQAALLQEKRGTLEMGWDELMRDEDFVRSISQATGNVKSVRSRFEKTDKLVHDVLNDHIPTATQEVRS